MERRDRMGVLQARKIAMAQLSELVVTEIPDHLPEIQQLRLRLSQARSLFLALELALQSLYERELPRSSRTIDENAFVVHLEAKALVAQALVLLGRMKDAI